MEEHDPQLVRELQQEVENEYGEEEELAPAVGKLLKGLHPDNLFSPRKRATEQLGRLYTSIRASSGR